MHYITAIENALSHGYSISVWDGEEWQVKRSTNKNDIVEAAQSVELCTLRIHRPDGERIGFIQVMPYIGAVIDGDDDSIVDHTDSETIRELIPA